MSNGSIDELLMQTEELPVAGDDGLGGDDPGDEADQIPPARRPFSKVSLALLAGVALVVAFGGGVLVQKSHDAGLTASAPAAGARPGGAGGAGGGAAFGGAGGGAGAATASSGPAVVGTVVSVKGADITVKDFAGKTHVVHTTGNTTVSVPGALAAIKAGSTVSVTGTSDPAGAVEATAVAKR
jgi:hypothetical protein